MCGSMRAGMLDASAGSLLLRTHAQTGSGLICRSLSGTLRQMGFPLCDAAQAFLDLPFPFPLPFLRGGSDFCGRLAGRLGCLGLSGPVWREAVLGLLWRF